MTESFISTRDRIISTAIEIINDSGITALNTKMISQTANLSEPLLYRFYGDINELLVDVVQYFFRFDKGIRKTIQSKEGSYTDKIRAYIEDYSIYYENYAALSTLMLQYEEFLHIPATREIMVEGAENRRSFLAGLFEGAISTGEIMDSLSPEELSDMFYGYMHAACLKRRFGVRRGNFRKDMSTFVTKMLDILMIEQDGGKE